MLWFLQGLVPLVPLSLACLRYLSEQACHRAGQPSLKWPDIGNRNLIMLKDLGDLSSLQLCRNSLSKLSQARLSRSNETFSRPLALRMYGVSTDSGRQSRTGSIFAASAISRSRHHRWSNLQGFRPAATLRSGCLVAQACKQTGPRGAAGKTHLNRSS